MKKEAERLKAYWVIAGRLTSSIDGAVSLEEHWLFSIDMRPDHLLMSHWTHQRRDSRRRLIGLVVSTRGHSSPPSEELSKEPLEAIGIASALAINKIFSSTYINSLQRHSFLIRICFENGQCRNFGAGNPGTSSHGEDSTSEYTTGLPTTLSSILGQVSGGDEGPGDGNRWCATSKQTRRTK